MRTYNEHSGGYMYKACGILRKSTNGGSSHASPYTERI